MAFFDSDGVQLYYEVHGEGPPVVLVHGFSSSFERNWKGPGWVRVLNAAGFQVVGLDVRGHGHSQKLYEPSAYATKVMAGDVLRLLDHLGIERADLMGFSMGGALSLHLAMTHPERLRKVVCGGVGDDALPGEHNPEDIREIRAALSAPSLSEVTGEKGRLFRGFAERGGNDLQALVALMSGDGWPGHLVRVDPIDLPLLFVEAEQDQVMSDWTKLLAAFPGARVVVVPRVHHNTLVGAREYKAAVVEFLT